MTMLNAKILALSMLVILGVLFILIYTRKDHPLDPSSVQQTHSVQSILGANETEGFAHASLPRQFKFPRDHGLHPNFKNEWWYYTGNLKTPSGRHFGFQLTIFRVALRPKSKSQKIQRTSLWVADHVYMGHFAITDVKGKRFYHFQRYSRGAMGLAGAIPDSSSNQNTLHNVWLDNWFIKQDNEMPVSSCSQIAAMDQCIHAELYAREDNVQIRLKIESLKPIVLQGDHGLSQKNDHHASYYYSITRLTVDGHIQINDIDYPVSGHAWLDREWSTPVLSEEQVGWDWFALQFSDNTELMFYQLRRKDGSRDPYSRGVMIRKDGKTQALMYQDVKIEVLDNWHSPRTGIHYPMGWIMRIPQYQIELTIKPLLEDQEFATSDVHYWEGAVSITGAGPEGAVNGFGYVELVGY